MMQWHDSWSWYWLAPTLLLWVLVLGAVVYEAVRLGWHDAQRH